MLFKFLNFLKKIIILFQDPTALLHIPKTTSWSNLYTTMLAMMISTYSTTRLFGALSISSNMTEGCVCMHITGRILGENRTSTSTIRLLANTGSLKTSSPNTKKGAQTNITVLSVMAGRSLSTTRLTIARNSVLLGRAALRDRLVPTSTLLLRKGKFGERKKFFFSPEDSSLIYIN